MHKHWQLSQCACAGNHISAAGQSHWVGLTDSLINQGHHRLPQYKSICIVIITGVNSVAFTSSWSASEHAKHGPASFTILILTLAANTATRIPAYIAAHFLWRTNIAGTYNPFNWHLQLSNCRTLGRASWFIHNNWTTPCLTTRPVLLIKGVAHRVQRPEQCNTPPPPPPSPPTITNTCDTTQACWPHYHHLGSWLSLSTVWSRLPAEKTPVCTLNQNFHDSPYSRWHLNFQSLGSGYSENSIPYGGIIISLAIRSGKDMLKLTSSSTRSSSFLRAK